MARCRVPAQLQHASPGSAWAVCSISHLQRHTWPWALEQEQLKLLGLCLSALWEGGELRFGSRCHHTNPSATGLSVPVKAVEDGQAAVVLGAPSPPAPGVCTEINAHVQISSSARAAASLGSLVALLVLSGGTAVCPGSTAGQEPWGVDVLAC